MIEYIHQSLPWRNEVYLHSIRSRQNILRLRMIVRNTNRGNSLQWYRSTCSIRISRHRHFPRPSWRWDCPDTIRPNEDTVTLFAPWRNDIALRHLKSKAWFVHVSVRGQTMIVHFGFHVPSWSDGSSLNIVTSSFLHHYGLLLGWFVVY